MAVGTGWVRWSLSLFPLLGRDPEHPQQHRLHLQHPTNALQHLVLLQVKQLNVPLSKLFARKPIFIERSRCAVTPLWHLRPPRTAKHFLEKRNLAASFRNAFSESAVSTCLQRGMHKISQENMERRGGPPLHPAEDLS